MFHGLEIDQRPRVIRDERGRNWGRVSCFAPKSGNWVPGNEFNLEQLYTFFFSSHYDDSFALLIVRAAVNVTKTLRTCTDIVISL